MTCELFKRPQAERDIEECFVYIAENNLDTAVYFLVAVEDSLDQLAEFPLVGKQRNFIDKQFQNIRMWHVKGYPDYLIFYQVNNNRIEIIRLIHGSRDINMMFSD